MILRRLNFYSLNIISYFISLSTLPTSYLLQRINTQGIKSLFILKEFTNYSLTNYEDVGLSSFAFAKYMLPVSLMHCYLHTRFEN